MLGYDTSILMNTVNGKPNMGYTNANSMARNAESAAQSGKIREISPEEAQ